MNDNHLTLFCLVDGELPPTRSLSRSSPPRHWRPQGLIKTTLSPQFDDITAKDSLWRVSIHDDDDNDLPVLLDSVPVKKKLRATNKLSMVFDADLPETRFTSLSSDPCQLRKENVRKMQCTSPSDFLPRATTTTLRYRFPHQTERECYVFGGRSTVRSGNIEAFKPFLSLPDTWYFVDSTPDPVLGRAKTVISASPKTLFSEAHQYQDVDKRVAWRYYMAPWSLEELKKCRISVVGFEVVPLEAVKNSTQR
ncbi:hypothetical protein F5H01DRAFT_401324 [Linnemannia elongata]|nr:hypothetical protein F5H01DRAFT_401324 [Linnemannia elongata]